jgi:phosphatidate phosphatase APP1
MSGNHEVLGGLAAAVRGALRLLARPVRSAVGSTGGVVLQPYRGYGSREEVFLIGRVFSQPTAGPNPPEGTAGRDAVDLGRRLLRRGIGGAALTARFVGTEQRVTTDQDGYFRVHLRPVNPPPGGRLWHTIGLELLSPCPLNAEGQLFVPPETCRFVVISDIDDTVMHTGVASKAMMLWRLFMQGAESRVAFPGVAAFLRALHTGVSGTEHNPMLYVSRAPWTNYEVLDAFFRLHGIPVGPLLFLREWGLTLQSPLPRRGKGHKLELIRNMLALYRDLPFVLVGDSGQRDPEIYAQVVREHPGRVLAVYVRNVSRDPERVRAIEPLALQVAGAGSTLVLASDSGVMAEHAAAHGLIGREALAEVLGERLAQEGTMVPRPTREVARRTPEETVAAVEHGRLEEALGSAQDEGAPPNVVVGQKDSKGADFPLSPTTP